MGTKNNPGNFDCYANAKPDEPMFVLLGRDRTAGYLVRLWARMRRLMGEDPAKVKEAYACADAMDAWARAQGKTPIAPQAWHMADLPEPELTSPPPKECLK